MKKLLFGWLLCVGMLPLQAQKIPPVLMRKTLTAQTGVAALSRQANQAAWAKLKEITRPLASTQIQAAQSGLPGYARRQVFQVQKGPFSRSTASAFALNINGRVWGVTAAHVMNNISLAPYMVITNEHNQLVSAPIAYQHIANSKGSDVAIFEIPKELLPYVEVLQPAAQVPTAKTVTQSPCFIRGNPFYLPSEDILFAGPHRLLLRDQAHREMTGYCGSPVLVDGKVVGLHVGAYSVHDIQTVAWNILLQTQNIRPTESLHVATPIERVEELALQVETLGTLEPTGMPLKVMGYTVAYLTPQEYIYSVQHYRNGQLQKTLHTHPFLNFEKLEEFFDLQEEDRLRITILSPKNISQAAAIKVYDINVSSGEVSHPF